MARAVTSVPQPLNRVPIALTQPMINPATARVSAACEEGAATAPEGDAVPGESVPEAGETVPDEEAGAAPERGVAGPGAWEPAPPRVRKRPMRTATRMPVITPNMTKARRHARNRTLRRSLCSEPPRLVPSDWCAWPRPVTVMTKPARLPGHPAPESGWCESSTYAYAG